MGRPGGIATAQNGRTADAARQTPELGPCCAGGLAPQPSGQEMSSSISVVEPEQPTQLFGALDGSAPGGVGDVPPQAPLLFRRSPLL